MNRRHSDRYVARRREQHKRHRKRVFSQLRLEPQAVDVERLQRAVSDWLFAISPMLEFSEVAKSRDRPGVRELWASAEIGGDVSGLRQARDVFLRRGGERLPIRFLRNVAVAINNATILLFDLPVHPPLREEGDVRRRART